MLITDLVFIQPDVRRSEVRSFSHSVFPCHCCVESAKGKQWFINPVLLMTHTVSSGIHIALQVYMDSEINENHDPEL